MNMKKVLKITNHRRNTNLLKN